MGKHRRIQLVYKNKHKKHKTVEHMNAGFMIQHLNYNWNSPPSMIEIHFVRFLKGGACIIHTWVARVLG